MALPATDGRHAPRSSTVTMMPDLHVTTIEETPDGKFICRCTCPWHTAPLTNRKAAVAAGRFHRANVAVQKL